MLHPCQICLPQELSESDFIIKVNLSEWSIRPCANPWFLMTNFEVGDKAAFVLSGKVNTWNAGNMLLLVGSQPLFGRCILKYCYYGNHANEWPDSPPCNFFLRDHIKNQVYQTPLQNLQELYDRILLAFERLQNNPNLVLDSVRPWKLQCKNFFNKTIYMSRGCKPVFYNIHCGLSFYDKKLWLGLFKHSLIANHTKIPLLCNYL